MKLAPFVLSGAVLAACVCGADAQPDDKPPYDLAGAIPFNVAVRKFSGWPDVVERPDMVAGPDNLFVLWDCRDSKAQDGWLRAFKPNQAKPVWEHKDFRNSRLREEPG